ncbi:MAG: hypothetical protein ACL7BU_00290 [Candidatus Phlomobacter fragariae]
MEASKLDEHHYNDSF